MVILAVMCALLLVPPLLRSWLADRWSSRPGFGRPITPWRLRPQGRFGRSGAGPAAGVGGSRARDDDRPSYLVGTGVGQAPSPGYRTRTARAAMRRRRQTVLYALLVATATTAVGAFEFGVNALVGVNLLVDGLLIVYVYLLVQVRRGAERRRQMGPARSRAA